MQARQFEHFLKQLLKLTRRQRERLLGLLAPAVKRDEAAGLIEQCTAPRLVCAGCGSRHFHKHGHAAYRSFAREAGITHEAVNLKAGVRVRGALHVQNVNAYHSRLRGWLQPFCGVASRYLGNYLGWCWALDGGRIRTPTNLLRAALGAGRPVAFNT